MNKNNIYICSYAVNKAYYIIFNLKVMMFPNIGNSFIQSYNFKNSIL